MSIRLAGTNTDRVKSADRAVAGRQPDGSSPAGAGSPTAGAGVQANLPDYTSGGTVPYKIILGLPTGASGSYNFTVANPTGGAWVTYQWNNFPVTLTMATHTTTFTGYAQDGAKTQSYADTESWDSLFL